MNPATCLTSGERASLACIWEASAPKAGNVYPGRSFSDLSANDFYLAAIRLGHIIDQSIQESVGETIYQAVQASKRVTTSNANLGMVLLLVPLAKATQRYPSRTLQDGLKQILQDLDNKDAAAVYDAIRLANPGGLGEVAEADVKKSAPESLINAMALAANHDSIARCYVTNFACIFDLVAPTLQKCFEQTHDWSEAIRETQLHVLSQIPDTLIARKAGEAAARKVSEDAMKVLQTEGSHERLARWEAFDHSLRLQANRLNPGTTADLIAAGLYVVFSQELQK